MSHDEFDYKFCNPGKQNFNSDFSKHLNSTTLGSTKCKEKFITFNFKHEKSSECETRCKQCHISYKDFQTKVNHSCMPYRCQLCSTAFLYDYQLKMHNCVKKSLGKKDDESEAFVCNFCHSTFAEPTSFSEHKAICMRKKKCNICDKPLPKWNDKICRICKNMVDKDNRFKGLYNSTSSTSVSDESVKSPITRTVDSYGGFHKLLNELHDDTSNNASHSHDSSTKTLTLQRKIINVPERSQKKRRRKIKKSSSIIPESTDSLMPSDRNSVQVDDRDSMYSFRHNRAHQSVTASETQDTSIECSEAERTSCNAIGGLVNQSTLFTKMIEVNKISEKNHSGSWPLNIETESSCHALSCTAGENCQKNNCKELKDAVCSTIGKGCDSQASTADKEIVKGNLHLQNKYEVRSKRFQSDAKKSCDAKGVFDECPKFSNFHRKRKRTDFNDVCSNPKKSAKENSKSNISIASLEGKEEAIKERLPSPDTSHNKGFYYDCEKKVVKRKLSKKHNTSTEKESESITLPLRSHEQSSLEQRRKASTTDGTVCKGTMHLTFLPNCDKSIYSKSNTQTFYSKINHEGSIQEKDPVSTPENLSSSPKEKIVGSKRQKTADLLSGNHRNRYSSVDKRKGKCRNFDKIKVLKRFLKCVQGKKKISPKFNDHNKKLSENPTRKERHISMKGKVTLECLMNSLPKGIGIMKSYNENCFRCVKCDAAFHQIKKVIDHFSACRYQISSSMLVSLDEVKFSCLKCGTSFSTLNAACRHQDQCIFQVSSNTSKSEVSVAIIHYYERLPYQYCKICSVPCKSESYLNDHNCTKRLSDMTSCFVPLEKLDESKYNHCLSSMACSICKEVFYNSKFFHRHVNMHSNNHLKAAKSSIDEGKAYARKEAKKIIKNNKECKTVKDMIDNIVKPMSEISTCMGTDDSLCLDLNLDASLTYEQQQLLTKAVEELFSEKTENLDELTRNIKLFIQTRELKNSSEEKDSTMGEQECTALADFCCKCKDKVAEDPRGEEKPCIKCLNEYVLSKVSRDILKLRDSAASVQDRDADVAPNRNSVIVASSCSPSIQLHLPRDSDSTMISVSHISNDSSVLSSSFTNFDNFIPSLLQNTPLEAPVICSEATPTNSFSSSASNSEDIGVSTASTGSNPIALSNNACTGISSENHIDSRGVIPSCSNKNMEDSACGRSKQMLLDSENIPNVSTSRFSPELSSNCEQTQSNDTVVNPDIWGESLFNRPIGESSSVKLNVSSNFKPGHSRTKVFFLVLSVKNLKVNVTSEKNLSFLNNLAHVQQTILTPPLTPRRDVKSPESVIQPLGRWIDSPGSATGDDCKAPKDTSSTWDQIQNTSNNTLQLGKTSVPVENFQIIDSLKMGHPVRLKCCLSFEDTMDLLLKNESDFSVFFCLEAPLNIEVNVNWTFDNDTEYSGYALKLTSQYACDICPAELSVSNLLDHLITQHKETVVNILIS